jgi:hypothetical protein
VSSWRYGWSAIPRQRKKAESGVARFAALELRRRAMAIATTRYSAVPISREAVDDDAAAGSTPAAASKAAR